jgi:hypothetical protein
MASIKQQTSAVLRMDVLTGEIFAEWHDPKSGNYYVVTMDGMIGSTPLYYGYASKESFTLRDIDSFASLRTQSRIKWTREPMPLPKAMKYLKQQF